MLGREDPTKDIMNEDAEIEGDVLILNPKKIGKHLPDLNFDK